MLDIAANSTEPAEVRMTPQLARALDVGERIFVILLAIPFLWAFAKSFSIHPTFVCVVASEMLSVFFILVRKGGVMAATPRAVAVAFFGTGFALLARPVGQAPVPSLISDSLMVAGLALAILSKLYLNRSFGMIAANRGVKVKGPYRFVRHPMYLGYIVDQVGFLLASFSIANLLVYVAAWAFQLLRIGEEEKMLREDAAYRQFAGRVKARLIPGIY